MRSKLSKLSILLPVLAACGETAPNQHLPGPTSAERRNLAGEVLETVTYTYREDGRLTRRTSSTGERIRFFYDAGDRLALIDFPSATGEVATMLVYHHDAEDRVERIETQDAASGELIELLRYDYDGADRVAYREVEVMEHVQRALELQRFAYHYDDRGRLLLEEPMISGEAVSYTYREDGALRHKDDGAVRTIYDHDAHGNVLSERIVAGADENDVRELWIYDYSGWDGASEEARRAPAPDTEYLSASVRVD